MKYSNTPEYTAQNKRSFFDGISCTLVIAGVLILAFAVVTFLEGVDQSRTMRILAESINKDYVGAEYLFSSDGIGLQLEGRIVGTDFWYHDILPAKFGDQIEIRIRVSYPEDNAYVVILPKRHVSAGLKLVDADHQQVVTPDGDKVDYFSPDSEHIQYIAYGVYEFGVNDWLCGRNFSSLAVGTESALLVVAPYNAAGLPRLILLIVVAALLIICACQRLREKKHESVNPA